MGRFCTAKAVYFYSGEWCVFTPALTEFLGRVPGCLVHEHRGTRAGRDDPADFVKVFLHGVRIGKGHYQRCTDTPRRADGTKYISTFVALVFWLAGPCAFFCPLVNDTILLSDPGFILPPDFDGGFRRQVGYCGCQRLGKVFLKVSISAGSCPGCCGRGDI